MSAFYTRLADTATSLLQKFGHEWSLVRTTGPGTSETRPAMAVVESTVRHELPGSGVEIGDKRLLVESAAHPAKGERIESGSERYVIVRVEPIRPAGITLAWWVWARAG